MGIMIEGKSRCKICGEIMSNKTQQLFGFRPFESDDQELSFFSDGIFHLECIMNHPLTPKLKKHIEIDLDENQRNSNSC